jgi:hypothetical protein
MPLLRELESMGTWICQRLFSWFLLCSMAQALPLSGLWVCDKDAAGISFFSISIIQTYHSINPFASNQCRQMAEGFLQIQTTALAEEFKTPEDGLAALEDRTITGI